MILKFTKNSYELAATPAINITFWIAIMGLLHLIKNKPLFHLLLPVFFVLHGFVRNYTAINGMEAFLLLCYYLLAALVIAGLAWLYFRDFYKAAFFSFCLLAFEFFFGAVQGFLKNEIHLTFLGQYRFLLPLALVLFTVLIIWLNRRKKPLSATGYYLHLLLLVLIIVDAVGLIMKAGSKEPHFANSSAPLLTACKDCNKPDIYFILLDQYAGNDALKDVFGFDNAAFGKKLQNRGFHVFKKSNSNYNLTPFSMASILNMDYLGPEMGGINHLNVTYSYRAVRNSLLIGYLEEQGYELNNFSVFDFPQQPSRQYSDFLPYGTELITQQTFSSKLWKDIKADIRAGKLPFKKQQKKLLYRQLQVNNELLQQVGNAPAEDEGVPRFIYAHLLLPHWPYYFDSKGTPAPAEELEQFSGTDATDYTEYLQYTNTRILDLVDSILERSSVPPVIILLGDHGFRHPEKKADPKYEFSNLAAILLPDRNYTAFPEEITAVNFFRYYLNHSFRQQLPMLKDSMINLLE